MSVINTSHTCEQSQPLSVQNPSPQLTETFDNDPEIENIFLQYLVIKYSNYQRHNSRKSTTNLASLTGSVDDRTPTSLFKLKRQRIFAAADRKKRIIGRIVSVVGILMILLCAAIVTLTLKMAPKIDELVRAKVGAHQLIHFVSQMNTPTSTTTTITTVHHDNYTTNGSIVGKRVLQIRRKFFA